MAFTAAKKRKELRKWVAAGGFGALHGGLLVDWPGMNCFRLLSTILCVAGVVGIQRLAKALFRVPAKPLTSDMRAAQSAQQLALLNRPQADV